MDPRIAWSPPEPLGPAYRHWLRLWEFSSGTNTNMRNGANFLQKSSSSSTTTTDDKKEDWERQHEFIPLHCKSYGESKQGLPYARKDYYTAADSPNNIASTYGLNHSSNLDILEKHKLIPWKKPDKRYSTHAMMW